MAFTAPGGLSCAKVESGNLKRGHPSAEGEISEATR